MLGSSYGRLINRLVVALDSYIVDHDCSIIATNSEQGRELRVEVKAHNS
jgi:hypothetical protein